ncbi:MAG: hypothetical protein AB1480_02410 [Nitrospirota bacterium]
MLRDEEVAIKFKDKKYEKSFFELSEESEKMAENVKHIVRVNSSGGFPSIHPSKKRLLERLFG